MSVYFIVDDFRAGTRRCLRLDRNIDPADILSSKNYVLIDGDKCHYLITSIRNMITISSEAVFKSDKFVF